MSNSIIDQHRDNRDFIITPTLNDALNLLKGVVGFSITLKDMVEDSPTGILSMTTGFSKAFEKGITIDPYFD